MSIEDIGPHPQAFDLEAETIENPNYRTVAWSGNYLQVTLMSIPVDGDIDWRSTPTPTSSFDSTAAGAAPRWDPARMN